MLNKTDVGFPRELTFEDLMYTCVSHVLLHREVLEVPISPMQLQCIIANVEASICSKEFGHGTQLHSRGSILLQSLGCIPHHQP